MASLTAAEAEGDISEILRVSRSRNRMARVTGCLLYTDSYFFQVLEGPHHEVEKIMDSINRDPRHRAVTPVSYQTTSVRQFEFWSMGFAALPGADILVEALLERPDSEEAVELVQALQNVLKRESLG